MSTTFKESGEVISLVASGADITVNSVVVVGRQLAVAATTIADGSTGIGDMEGVHRLPKTAGAAIDKGTAPVWNVSAGAFVPDGTALAEGDIGGAVTCWEDAGSAATEVLVKLNTGIGTIGTA